MAPETPPTPDDNTADHGQANAPTAAERQRAARRDEEIAARKSGEITSRRNRKIGIVVASAAAVVLTLVVGLFFATTNAAPETAAPATAAPTTAAPAASVDGVQTFPKLTAEHVTGSVTYDPLPPVGGDHSATLLNCGVYSEAVPNEPAVHSLEHGAVWITYDAAAITGDQLATLRSAIPASYAILSPFSGLTSPIVASAWGAQLAVTDPADSRLAAFIAAYRGAATAPEPGAPCTGGLNGPGKVS
jgi:hypothetical protein